MDFLLTVFLFEFGLIFGSFLNVLVWRLNDEKAPKFWQGRSVCPNCKKEISWKDNIPLLSFILLGGKCRHCHKKISWRYPLLELVSGISIVLVWQLIPVGLDLPSKVGVIAIIFSMLVIFFSDVEFQLIPDEMIVLLTIVGTGLGFHLWPALLGQHLVVGLLSSLGFFLVVLATKFRGMGLGDVKLAFVIGLLLGWPATAVAFWMAFVIGGIFAVGLVLLKKVRVFDTIALGPFLIFGLLISALWSKQILGLVGF